jgi:hypothetical protein
MAAKGPVNVVKRCLTIKTRRGGMKKVLPPSTSLKREEHVTGCKLPRATLSNQLLGSNIMEDMNEL